MYFSGAISCKYTRAQGPGRRQSLCGKAPAPVTARVKIHLSDSVCYRQNGIPPWNADGIVNPHGLLECRPEDIQIKKANKLVEYGKEVGFSCRQCTEWVPIAPRAFEGGTEPYFWWWCVKCRKLKKHKHKHSLPIDTGSFFEK